MDEVEAEIRLAFIEPRRKKKYSIISFWIGFWIISILWIGDGSRLADSIGGILCCGPLVGLLAVGIKLAIETDIIMYVNKNEFLTFKENYIKQKNDAKAFELQTQKDRKLATFEKKNYQTGHRQPTMAMKEKAWKRSDGNCHSCIWDVDRALNFTNDAEVSFYWRIFPSLELVLLCDICAELDSLLESHSSSTQTKSRRISEEVKDAVWIRDQGKCTQCGSNENLEFDHIIPFSKGGANTKRNIQLLCEPCNRTKSDRIG